MTKIKTFLLLLSGIVLVACDLFILSITSPAVANYRSIHIYETEYDLAFAFLTALRTNHTKAYEMVDPALKPRLDKWMNAHQPEECSNAWSSVEKTGQVSV